MDSTCDCYIYVYLGDQGPRLGVCLNITILYGSTKFCMIAKATGHDVSVFAVLDSGRIHLHFLFVHQLQNGSLSQIFNFRSKGLCV